MIKYIKIHYAAVGGAHGYAYQEVENGNVIRYVDEHGDALFTDTDHHGKVIYGTPPGTSHVVDVEPVLSPEALAKAEESRRPYSVEGKGDRRNPTNRRRQADRDADSTAIQCEIYRVANERIGNEHEMLTMQVKRLMAEVERLTMELTIVGASNAIADAVVLAAHDPKDR